MSSPVSSRPPSRKQLMTCVANLRRAYPDRLAGLDDETVVETMLGPDLRGRPRNCAEEDDRRLYAIAFTECLGVEPDDGLKEMLGSTTHPEFPKLSQRYKLHGSDIYRKGPLALRWVEETELLVVTPTAADELPSMPELPFDTDELLKNSPFSHEVWAALQAFANK